MKKIILVLSLVLALGLGSMFVYAADASTLAVTEDNTEATEWFKERMELRIKQLEEAKDKGEITEEEYKTWEKHITDMEEFHKENGFPNGGGFGGGCNGAGRGANGFGGMMRGGFNGGFGGGMMRNGNTGWNNN